MILVLLGSEHDGLFVVVGTVLDCPLVAPGTYWWLRSEGESSALFSPDRVDPR
jgi:hypothetical protein